jgi:hypothetical protein
MSTPRYTSSIHTNDTFEMIMNYVNHQYQGLPEQFVDIPMTDTQLTDLSYYEAMAASEGQSSSAGSQAGQVKASSCGCTVLVIAAGTIMLFIAWTIFQGAL